MNLKKENLGNYKGQDVREFVEWISTNFGKYGVTFTYDQNMIQLLYYTTLKSYEIQFYKALIIGANYGK